MTMTRRLARAALALALAWLAWGCEPPEGASGPVEVCEKIGQQCKLGGGKLGVCQPAGEPGSGQLACMSQH